MLLACILVLVMRLAPNRQEVIYDKPV